MISDKIWQRSDLLGTQVITRNTGKRLGVVSQIWVDVDRREVVALGLRENVLAGLVGSTPQYMYLSSICQIGDVILVENDDVLEDINVDSYSKLIQSEVITETGEPLGRVRGFQFNVEDGKVSSLMIASLGLPQIPDQLVSTYELPIEEVVSSGPDRLIVFEGSEERINQLTTGLLERLGIGRAPWENEEEEDYIVTTTPASNQLGKGAPVSNYPPARSSRPAISDTTWDEDNWEEPAPRVVRRQQQIEPAPYYEEEEEDNWSEASTNERYDDYEEEYEDDYEEEYEEEYEEVFEAPRQQQRYMTVEEEDIWADEAQKRKPPKLNLPDKTKIPEYEDGTY